MKEILKYFFYGAVMGGSNAVPGVSGGTIAVILNFYDKLMSCITLDLKKIKENLPFLFPLGLGLGLGLIGVSKLMGIVLTSFPTQIYLAFVGVVLGSVPLLLHKAKKGEKLQASGVIAFVIFFALIAFLTSVKVERESVVYKTLTVESFAACAVGMAIGTMSMIVPGLSGSLILAIMGLYETIFGEMIGNLNFQLLIPGFVGAAVGFLLGAKLIRYLLENYRQATYMAILGLLGGSVIELIRNAKLPSAGIFSIGAGIVCFILMFMLICFFSFTEIKRDKEEVQ